MHEMIATAIHKMACVCSDEAKARLKHTAKGYSLEDWKAIHIAKLAGVGALTGVLGGPAGLLLEGMDIAYLLAAAGRGCYEVGQIKDRDLDYDADLAIILAIWCGAAEAGAAIAAGKIGIKLAGKAAIGMGANVAGKLAGKVAIGIGANVAGKLAGKVFAKSAMKFGSKAAAKVVAYAAAKPQISEGSRLL